MEVSTWVTGYVVAGAAWTVVLWLILLPVALFFSLIKKWAF